jgi:transposase-like protein
MPKRPGWSAIRLRQVDQEFCNEIAGHIAGGATIKQAARLMDVPAGVLRRWLADGADMLMQAYEQKRVGPVLEPEGLLYVTVERAAGKRATDLIGEIAKASKDDEWRAKAWLLERLEAEEFGDTKHVDVTVGGGGAPIAVEGRAVVGLADVVAFVRQIEQEHLLGLDREDPRGELPAAGDVLPDPAGDQPPTSDVPADRPA